MQRLSECHFTNDLRAVGKYNRGAAPPANPCADATQGFTARDWLRPCTREAQRGTTNIAERIAPAKRKTDGVGDANVVAKASMFVEGQMIRSQGHVVG